MYSPMISQSMRFAKRFGRYILGHNDSQRFPWLMSQENGV